jgi:hypothetical protein
MPFLDAEAECADPQGLAFLKAVLGEPANATVPTGAFDVEAIRLTWTVSTHESGRDVARTGREAELA